jgi:signal peptidase II
VQNTGAAFSILQGHTLFLILFTAIAMSVCVYAIITDFFKSTLINWALLLCVGGGLGNIIDRIRLNYVIDFIECTFFDFPVFNIADIAVTVGAGLICIYIIKEIFTIKNK